jgi:hypothetical protein
VRQAVINGQMLKDDLFSLPLQSGGGLISGRFSRNGDIFRLVRLIGGRKISRRRFAAGLGKCAGSGGVQGKQGNNSQQEHFRN